MTEIAAGIVLRLEKCQAISACPLRFGPIRSGQRLAIMALKGGNK
jgi:hypothetical protein